VAVPALTLGKSLVLSSVISNNSNFYVPIAVKTNDESNIPTILLIYCPWDGSCYGRTMTYKKIKMGFDKRRQNRF